MYNARNSSNPYLIKIAENLAQIEKICAYLYMLQNGYNEIIGEKRVKMLNESQKTKRTNSVTQKM